MNVPAVCGPIFGQGGPQLYGIAFQDNGNLDLLFHRSNDEGANWNSVVVESSGTIAEALDCLVLSSTVVIIAYSDGTNGRIRFAKSTDGGTNWTLSTVTTELSPTSISLFALDTTNYFIAYNNGGTGDVKLAKSTDGGTNWSVSTVDSAPTNTAGATVFAIDANTILVAYYDNTSGSVVKCAKSTTGGGTGTWTVNTVDGTGIFDVGGLWAISSTTYVIVFLSTGAGGDMKLAKSTDGGTNWTLSTIVTGANGASRHGWISVIDANTILVIHRNLNTLTPSVLKTTDGGSNWSSINPDGSFQTSAEDHSIWAIDAQTYIAAWKDSQNNDLRYGKTMNGSSSWTRSSIYVSGDIGDLPRISAARGLRKSTRG